MEATPSGVGEMVRKHRLKRENLDPRKWVKREHVKGFTDFITSQHSDKDTDNSFDNKEMCEYLKAERANDVGQEFPLTRRLCEPKLQQNGPWEGVMNKYINMEYVMCPVLEAEKLFIEAAKRNDVETMRAIGRGLNANAKNVVSLVFISFIYFLVYSLLQCGPGG